MSKTTKEITKTQQNKIQKYDMDKPEQLTKMAVVLKTHIVKNDLYTNIKGKNYAHVEGWQFAGGLLGVYPKMGEVKDLSSEDEIKWLAKASLVEKATGKVVGRGYSLCSNKEQLQTKKGKFTRWEDEYAVLSMAQTRAIGKAYRNSLGWVMKLAGYEGTPAEEMDGQEENKSNKKAATAEYECHESGCPMTEAEKNYSVKMYGKPYCRDHQKGRKKVSAKK